MEWFSEASPEVSAAFSQLYGLPLPEVSKSPKFLALKDNGKISRTIILASIPTYPVDPYRPVHILYLVLTELSGPWPPSLLFYHFTRLTKGLTPGTYARQQEDIARLLQSTEKIIKKTYNSLRHFLDGNDLPALYSDCRQDFITHRQLKEFVTEFALPLKNDGKRTAVALLLPDGPLLAALCVAVATYYIAVPIAPNQSPSQIQSDLTRAEVSCIITSSKENPDLSSMRQWLREKGIKVVTAELGSKSCIRDERGHDVNASVLPRPRANKADSVCLKVFNSSPWLKRELVAVTPHELLREAYRAAESWELTPNDTGVSLASVHDAGLSKMFLAPLLSGGSVVCCSPTDVPGFWDAVERVQPSWYIASQSTHKNILANAPFQSNHVERSKFRLACGADGFIPPQLASLIWDVFGCASVIDPLRCDDVLSSADLSLPKKLSVSRQPSEPSEDVSPTGNAWENELHNWRRGSEQRGTTGSISRRNSNRRASQQQLAQQQLVPGRRKSSKFSTLSGKTIAPRAESVDQTGKDDFLGAIGANDNSITCNGSKILPEEVEEAIMAASEIEESPIYRRIAQVLAFPTTHDILGQDVAVILVSRPESPRVGLRTLHDALLEVKLDRVKWPMLIVYMDSIPQRNGQPLRTRLQQRLYLPPLSSGTGYLARHWEATCPPHDASFMKEIDRKQCQVEHRDLTTIINSVVPSNFRAFLQRDAQNGGYEAFLAPEVSLASLRSMRDDWEEYIRRLMTITTHGYMVPVNIYMLSVALPRKEDGSVDEKELAELRSELRKKSHSDLDDSIKARVKAAFAAALSRDVDTIDAGSNFFQLGGNRAKAEKFLRRLRVEFNIDLTHSVMAKDATLETIARYIVPEFEENTEKGTDDEEMSELYSSRRWWLMALQLLPMIILYPARRSAQWTVQLWLLSRTRFWENNSVLHGRLFNLILSILGAWASVTLTFPLVGIILKWIIIGRYKEGQYPMWGTYHTRWWMVQKITSLCGMGFFELNDFGKSLYCRLMGAKIGKGVKMNNVVLGEWDLLDIRDGVSLTKCQVRPFAAEKNSTMYLARIVIGERAVVGVFSIIAPGTEILPDTCLGTNSSSWEQRDSITSLSLENQAGPRIRDPHWILTVLLTYPIHWLGWCIALTPWLGAQIPVQYLPPQGSNTPLRVILNWFNTNPQIAFHYVAVMGRVLITPMLTFGFAALFRFTCIVSWGDLPTDTSQVKGHFPSWRSTIMKTLYPESQLTEMNELLGQHHEARSFILRALGAKIGKRVCWPNIGPTIADYHLLNIGDDVTFGSDVQLMTTDEHSSGVITIQKDAVLGDHACLLPGVSVGERTTIGFGTLTKRGKEYPSDKAFVGCRNGDVAHSDSYAHRLWDGPTLPATVEEAESSESDREERKNSDITLVDMTRMATRMEEGGAGIQNNNRELGHATQGAQPRKGSQHDRPWYRARHLKEAPYLMLSPLATLGFSMFMTVFTEFYWNVPALSAMKLAAGIFVLDFKQLETKWDPVVLYLLNTITTIALTFASAMMAIGFVLIMKKLLVGQYKPGIYDWDKSSFPQRWQILLAVEKLIQHCYVDKGGIITLLTGTEWLVLYYRALGAKIGKDCALFASGNPSLMLTEPDLIEMGDRVVVDNAAIISHLDRRGSIQLDKIKIGNRCVLRSSSNILMGSVMKDDSCLLEHTLILPGGNVEEGWTMHRRPGERFLGNRKGTIPKDRHSVNEARDR
ncbi:hypothetical protein QQS21_010119 [Conoideocrella luteorostrata]|uniref:Carrier domain-containing protein n=1 Tax=Conoideocrella luteorostrata TaxID=1105319 RepID=A0AAJ0FX77_9HYPO|nr:hypothetical protein QQS21_010119 [Conoideocrella luteorostrata]